MIENVSQCPFCSTTLTYGYYFNSLYNIECWNERNHSDIQKRCWGRAEYVKPKYRHLSFNIRINEYQLHWSFINPSTTLICYSTGQNKTIITLPYLIDFEITEANFNRKIQTLLTFI